MDKIMTDWWNKNVPDQIDRFKQWIGDYQKEDKVYCRQYVAQQGYKSILDCGCGVATEYYGYKNDNYDIDYTGLDSCDYFIAYNQEQGIDMVRADLEKDIPLSDNTFDCVYAREIIEHLTYYEVALSNFIRLAQKEVIIGWFIKPHKDAPDLVDYWDAEDLYHNRYNIEKLESWILTNSKVSKIFWKDISDNSSILHIALHTFVEFK
jgi:ubiquinone/menaquinone biosynthesis C-methylase UbiE